MVAAYRKKALGGKPPRSPEMVEAFNKALAMRGISLAVARIVRSAKGKGQVPAKAA